jgi:hypothetical protein
MGQYYECFTCRKVASLAPGDEPRCNICGKTNGQVLTRQQVSEGREAGVFFDIDLKTGRRAKKKRRR